ncbi:Metallophosphoesterase, partial [mine drainage metagenome]
GIPVVIVYGNHDAESQLTRRLRLPPNTTVLSSTKPETHIFSDLGVAVHGQSYATRAIGADLSLAYPKADPGLVNIGMLHTCFDGSLGHDPYAPCSLAGLRSKGYDYWALGHVHDHRVVCEDPMVVFPGNLQGRHIRETGPKGATLVNFVDHEPSIEQLTFDIVR